MTWDALIGQDAAVAYLRSALKAGRAAHGYLLEGPSGVGKRTAAALLAQVLLCHAPPAPDLACGECRSCRWLAARQGLLTSHPDLLPLLKSPGDPKRERPLGDQEQVIPLETIQYLAEKLHRTPLDGPRRVAIIPEAQRMCGGQAEAANAFLKTLEEPPASSFVILTSSRPEALLETILSRVQPVRLRRLPDRAIREGLERGRGGDADVDLAIAMSDGSLGRAREMLDGDLGRWRAELMKQLRGLNRHACPEFGLALWALALAEGERLFAEGRGGGAPEPTAEPDPTEGGEGGAQDDEKLKTEAVWQRYVFARLLQLCEAAFRDGLLAAAGAGPEQLLILKGADAPLAGKLARDFGLRGCERVLDGLREALRAVRLYVRGDVVARVVAGRLVENLGGGG